MSNTSVGRACVHRSVCGDSLIERELPGFFLTHEHAPPGHELQVCLYCGYARLVRLIYDEEAVRAKQRAYPQVRPDNKGSSALLVPIVPIVVPIAAALPGKTCTKCKQRKDTSSDFHRNRNTKDGFASWCKPCMREKSRECRQRRIEHYRDMARQWNSNHPGKLRTAKEAYLDRQRAGRLGGAEAEVSA